MVSKLSKKLIIYIALICLIYSIIVFAFFFVSFFDKNLLLKLFDKYDIYKSLPFDIPMDDVKKFVYELMDFLKGKEPFLNTTVHINGIETAFYSTTSKIHMADCRNLFLAHGYLAKVMLLPSVFGIVWTIMSDKEWYNTIYKTYKNILLFFSILLLIILSFSIINFDLFFTMFHKIFFRNDLWIFDPTKDFIINYLPYQIFIDIGIRILIIVILILFLLFLSFYFLKKTLSRQEAK